MILQTYQSTLPLVTCIAREFQRKHGGHLESLLEKANTLALSACEQFNPGQAGQSTWVWLKVWYGLLKAKTKEYRESANLKNIPQPNRFRWDLFWADLGDDAQVLVRALLDPGPLGRGEGGASRKKEAARYLLGLGWAASRVVQAFREVGEALG